MIFLIVAVVGSRNVPDPSVAYAKIVESIPRNCSEIISGGASGIDLLAKKYAMAHGLAYKEIAPDYTRYGASAPLLRNTEIVRSADIVYAFWDMHSRGTADTISKCISIGKPFRIVPL